MAYCNWCMLESETADFCIWCKRPLGTAQGVSQQARNDLHFLRNSEDEHEPAPVFAIIGALAFLSIVIGAILLYHAKADQTDGQHWVLKEQADQEQQQAAIQQAQQQEPVVRSAFNTPPSPPAQIPYRPDLGAPAKPSFPTSHRLGADDYTYPTKSIGGFADHAENTLYFESADFKPIVDKKGKKHLIGDIVVVNDTYGNLTAGSLWLRAGNSQFELERYDGSINEPRLLHKFTISNKASIKCHVLADGVNPDIPYSGRKVLGMDALVEGQPVHLTDELVIRL